MWQINQPPILLFLLTFLLFGCTDLADSESSDDSAIVELEDDSLRGRWTLNSFNTNEQSTNVEKIGRSYIVFEETGVSGNGGCNGFSGRYEKHSIADRLIAFDKISVTAMLCTLGESPDAALHSQEDQFLDALLAVESYEVIEGALILNYGEQRFLRFTTD